ncbi:MAG: metallophosphoesterase [Alphaproteobacteria bacterium]|nr:metallophosphoesterase [Alphaproteobacteria bacterium]
MHPYLMPAFIGALVSLPILIFGAWRLAKRWRDLRPRTRWIAFTVLTALELVYWCNVYAWFVEPNRLVVRRYDIESPNWTGAPLTIAAIGDIHVVSPHVPPERVARIVARANALDADLVVLLGDYVGGHTRMVRREPEERAQIAEGLSYLAALDAPLGVVAVIGNHDVWYDRQAVTSALQEAGVATLWNQNVMIDRDAGAFALVGLEDEVTGAPDYARAREGADAGAPEIVLSHSPDVFPGIPATPALTLAAHTHCGQVTIPLIGRPVVPSHFGQRYACGRIEEEGKQMIVTGGIGTSILALRFLNPPEIALITLRAAPED